MKMRNLILTTALLACGVAAAADVAPSADQVRPLLIGAELPETSLRDADGNAFDLRAAVKKKPAVLIFYRGGW